MIEKFSRKHLHDVVDLHYKILHWSMNSQLGKKHIHSLYDNMLSDNDCFGFVYIENDRLLGVITGTLDYESTRKKLKSLYKFNDKIKLLLLCISKPVCFLDLFESNFLIPRMMKKLPTEVEGLTLVTDTHEKQNVFAVFACIKAFNNFLQERNISHWMGQVVKYDPKPNELHSIIESELIKSYIRNNVYLMRSDK